MIELCNLSKRFGARWAVQELNLKIARGDIYGLLGHNGAGKSTAIGMMLGQVWPTGGQARLFGFDVATDRSQALARVGAIFESPAFYDYLSGWRNLQILSSYSAPTPAKKIAEVLEWVGLNGREHSKVRTYSHGMRARLALAQALLPEPQLLILDEPGDGLDPEGIHEMRETIQRLHREFNLTILLSSHLLNEVEQLCTRISVLNRGRLVFEGTLAETRERRQWVRLKTSDFAAATSQLREAGLVSETRENLLLALSDGVGIDAVVQFLVEHGFAVHEIAPQEQTLEEFYLDLMKKSEGPRSA